MNITAESFPPGTQAMLVYHDEHGQSCSSLVEIVKTNGDLGGMTWYTVIGQHRIFSMNHLAVPLEKPKIDVKDGLSFALVPEDKLAPVGTRLFRIVQ